MQAARPVALVLSAAHATSAVSSTSIARSALRFSRLVAGLSMAVGLAGTVDAARAWLPAECSWLSIAAVFGPSKS